MVEGPFGKGKKKLHYIFQGVRRQILRRGIAQSALHNFVNKSPKSWINTSDFWMT